MAVDTLPNVDLTCDPRPFTAAIIATAIAAAMRPYSMRRPLAAAVRAIQHCAVETDERGGRNGLLYLSIGRTSGLCRFSVSVNAICTRNLCCHTEGNELLGFPVQNSRGIHHGQRFVPMRLQCLVGKCLFHPFRGLLSADAWFRCQGQQQR